MAEILAILQELLFQMIALSNRGIQLKLSPKIRIWTLRLEFGPCGWDFGLKAKICIKRVRIGILALR